MDMNNTNEYQEPNFLEILSNTYEFNSSQTNEIDGIHRVFGNYESEYDGDDDFEIEIEQHQLTEFDEEQIQHLLTSRFQIGNIQTTSSNSKLEKYLCSNQNDVSSDELCSICINQLIAHVPDYSNSENKICSISCGHKFHQKCIVEWLIKKTNCPECRQYCKVYNKDKNEFESIAPIIYPNVFVHDYYYDQIMRDGLRNDSENTLRDVIRNILAEREQAQINHIITDELRNGVIDVLRNGFRNVHANGFRNVHSSMNELVNNLRNLLRDGSGNELRHDSENILRGVLRNILTDGLVTEREREREIEHAQIREIEREREHARAQINYITLDEQYYRVVNYQNQETHDVNIQDVRLVSEQSGCDISQAIDALIRNDGDIVNAIMELTMP